MMTNMRQKILALLILAGALTACAPSGDTTTISPFPSRKVMSASVGGIVPGALHNDVTPLGYVASSTVGEPTSGIVQVTPKGYTAYSSVQGDIASE